MKGENSIQLRKDPVARRSSGRKAGGSRKRPVIGDDINQAAWDHLRACRKALADQQGVPPYVIFHDATLYEMLKRLPRTREELGEITGVGAAKLEKYGETFLQALAEAASL